MKNMNKILILLTILLVAIVGCTTPTEVVEPEETPEPAEQEPVESEEESEDPEPEPVDEEPAQEEEAEEESEDTETEDEESESESETEETADEESESEDTEAEAAGDESAGTVHTITVTKSEVIPEDITIRNGDTIVWNNARDGFGSAGKMLIIFSSPYNSIRSPTTDGDWNYTFDGFEDGTQLRWAEAIIEYSGTVTIQG